jgi:hypothetical protein
LINAYNILVEKPKLEIPLQRKILRWIFMKKGMRVWTGFIWLRMGTSGGLL